MSIDHTLPLAASEVSNEVHRKNFVTILKEDVDKFEVVNRQTRQLKKNNQRRYVVGDSTAQAPFVGVSKKVLVCISRLKSDTSVETIENFLRSKGIKVMSCFKYTDRYSRFSLMRVCISVRRKENIRPKVMAWWCCC